MSRYNNKGFFLIETIVVVVVVMVLLLVMYRQLVASYNSYEQNAKYNSISSIHAANNLKRFLSQGDLTSITKDLGNNPFIDITGYNMGYESYFNTLKSVAGIDKIYFMKYNINSMLDNMNSYNFDAAFSKYLLTLRVASNMHIPTKYRIVVVMDDNTYGGITLTVNETTPYYTDATGAARPELSSAMIPIRWDGSKWVKADVYSKWYDYANKEWANAVLVNENTRSFYQRADAGTTITESDVLGYFVWIPRYAYKIGSGYHTGTASTIGIKFLISNSNVAYDGTTVVAYSAGNSASNYVVHPAFNFGTTPVTGMWVSKFEASQVGAKIRVKPNVTSWTNIILLTMFDASRAMELDSTYGWGSSGSNLDTHMMKNTEWGAVAYLSRSAYGKNGEIWINNINSDTGTGYLGTVTGCAGSSVSAAMVRSATCPANNQYNTATGVNASTTGNITGIYDMSGGSWEYVMGNYDRLVGSSGFTSVTIDALNDKYIDRYSSATNYSYNNTYYGDAYYETSADAYINNASGPTTAGWHSDSTFAPYSAYPWFERGGGYDGGTNAGAFDFYRNLGGAITLYSFRSVVLVAPGL